MSTVTVPTGLRELTGTWSLDTAHSRVGFVARHAMVAKIRGGFSEFEGTVVIGDDIDDATIDVTIVVGSVDTRNADRDAHLRSSDFLEAETYPAIRFSSTSVKAEGATLHVTGALTIKDVTRSVTVPFEFGGTALDPFGNVRTGFEGSVVINRSDFGVTWNAALETGGVLISDKIVLELEVSAVRSGLPDPS